MDRQCRGSNHHPTNNLQISGGPTVSSGPHMPLASGVISDAPIHTNNHILDGAGLVTLVTEKTLEKLTPAVSVYPEFHVSQTIMAESQRLSYMIRLLTKPGG